MNFFRKLFGPFYYGIAMAKFTSNHHKEAAKLLENAYKFYPHPDRPEYYYSCLGRCYLAIEKYDEAYEALQRSWELNPNYDHEHYLLLQDARQARAVQ